MSIKFYSHKLVNGYMSNFYGIIQDKKFSLTLPLDDYINLDPIYFYPSEDNCVDFPTSEHAFQIQKYIDNKENMKYIEIMFWIKEPMSVAYLGRKVKSKTKVIFRGKAPKHIKDKYKNTYISDIINEYNNIKIRDDWENIKYKIMYFILVQKFMQNNHLLKSLQSTGDSELIEHTRNDSYWGDGGGKGLNKLGEILMDIREELV